MTKLTSYGFILGALLAVSALGCGGSSQQNAVNTSNTSSANLRFLVLNPSVGNVSVSVDGVTVNGALPYLGDTGYVPIRTPGGHLGVITTETVVVAPFDAPLDLTPNSHNTFLLDGWAHFESSSCLLSDDNTPAPNSAAKLRILDATLGVIHDIYLLPAGMVPNGSPQFPLSAFNNATSYQTLAPGNYEVFVARAATTTVLFDTGPITLAAGQNRTLVLFGNCQPHFCDPNVLTSLMLADLN
jgi:hypothetical protein